MVDSSERRHQRRVDTRYRATLRRKGERIPTEVLDFSSGGCKLWLDAPFTRGEEVVLEIESFGTLRAVVAWAREGRAGLRFDEPPERVGELAMAMATYGPA